MQHNPFKFIEIPPYMMHGIFHGYVLKMCVHTPQAQSHSLALIEPIQEPKRKVRITINKYNKLEGEHNFFFVQGTTSLAIISTARSPCSTGRPSSTDESYTEVACTRGLNAAGPVKRYIVIKPYEYARMKIYNNNFAVIITEDERSFGTQLSISAQMGRIRTLL